MGRPAKPCGDRRMRSSFCVCRRHIVAVSVGRTCRVRGGRAAAGEGRASCWQRERLAPGEQQSRELPLECPRPGLYGSQWVHLLQPTALCWQSFPSAFLAALCALLGEAGSELGEGSTAVLVGCSPHCLRAGLECRLVKLLTRASVGTAPNEAGFRQIRVSASTDFGCQGRCEL